jgi:hypothetical protein
MHASAQDGETMCDNRKEAKLTQIEVFLAALTQKNLNKST